MSTTTVRMDDDLKAEVNAILDSMGLNFNTFVNMASVQLVSQRRIPFEVKAPEPVLPRAGRVAANGVTYRGVDEQGYPVVEVPNAMVLNPSRGADGVAVLPKAWRDGDKLLVRLELLVGRDSPIKGGPDLWLHVLVLPFERLVADDPHGGPSGPSVMESARQLARVPVKHVQQ